MTWDRPSYLTIRRAPADRSELASFKLFRGSLAEMLVTRLHPSSRMSMALPALGGAFRVETHARHSSWRVCSGDVPGNARPLPRLDGRIGDLDREIARRAREHETARRLMTIPGIGPITATALIALTPAAESG